MPDIEDGQVTGLSPLSVYTEAAPLRDDRSAIGLNRVLNPLLECVRERLSDIVVLPMDKTTHRDDINPRVVSRTILLGAPTVFLEKAAGRIAPWAAGLALRAAITGLRKKPVKTSLVVVGASHRTLIRGRAVASHRRSALSFYIVDDFVEASSHMGRPIDEAGLENIRRALQSAGHVWCITDTLGDRISERFKVKCETLPLVHSLTDYPAGVDKPNQFIFVGSVNYLYRDALQMFVSAIASVNVNRAVPLTLRLTVPAAVANSNLGPLPDFVRCEPIEARSALLSEIQSSRAAVLPCSFVDTYRPMVESSFPSKTLDYLEAAKDIVLISPPYSSAAQYFSRNNAISRLSNVAEISSYLENSQPVDKHDYLSKFLEERHSQANIKSRLACI